MENHNIAKMRSYHKRYHVIVRSLNGNHFIFIARRCCLLHFDTYQWQEMGCNVSNNTWHTYEMFGQICGFPLAIKTLKQWKCSASELFLVLCEIEKYGIWICSWNAFSASAKRKHGCMFFFSSVFQGSNKILSLSVVTQWHHNYFN